MNESTASQSLPRLQKLAFFILLLLCLTPYVSIPAALFMGLAFAILFRNPYPDLSKKTSRYLLQISVVGLGFGMNLFEALKAGKEGILFTIVSVFGVLLLGIVLGKLFKLEKNIAYLISAGTAICGGSAIAAVAPIVKAKETEISVSIGTVFILNAIALFIFPVLGHAFHMPQDQFGTWAAIAIHDVSSVVGAGAAYGEEALKIATTVKLTRALWIIPVALVTSFFFRHQSGKIYKPWFILFFCTCHGRQHVFADAGNPHGQYPLAGEKRICRHPVSDRNRSFAQGHPYRRRPFHPVRRNIMGIHQPPELYRHHPAVTNIPV